MSLAHKIFASLKAGGDGAASSSPTTATASASPSSSWNERFLHVAVQGCCHGELDRIYDACREHERQTGKRIDLLLCCGDFQAVRTAPDMDSMAVPDKYKVLGDFHKYYADIKAVGATPAATATASAAVPAPYLTIFVGGNHENSDLLAQESYGGFVAPNIFYLGHSGVIVVDDELTIAGLSGIFKEQDYDRVYPPRPYAASYVAKKAAYHVRRIEVAKLHAYVRAVEQRRAGGPTTAAPLAPPLVDIFLSHDWPVGITAHGDEAQLLRFKPFFAEDIRRRALGNPHTMALLREARPTYWFAAHLHCYFEATISHAKARTAASGSGAAAAEETTRFVALDKCDKGHGFLTFIDIPRRRRGGNDAEAVPAESADRPATAPPAESVRGAARIRRDPLWLRVLQASHACVAANRTAGFDAAAVSEGGNTATPLSSAALSAPTTEALLTALHLPPALPLQQAASPTAPAPEPALHSNRGRYEANNREGGTGPVAPGYARPHPHQRPRTEAPLYASHGAPSPTSHQPPPRTSTLDFFEDVGTTRSAPASSAGVVPAATPSTPPSAPAGAVLSWFEDTSQPP